MVLMPENWKKIKAEYIRGGTSYRKLAEKYGVSFSSIRRMAEKEKWTDLRTKTMHKANTKIVESVSNQEAKKFDQIQTIADLLMEKIKEGIADGSLVKDSKDIRAIMSSLKDLKDIKGCKSELDMQEQIARIDKLRKEASIEEQNNEIRVVFGSDLEDYSS